MKKYRKVDVLDKELKRFNKNAMKELADKIIKDIKKDIITNKSLI